MTWKKIGGRREQAFTFAHEKIIVVLVSGLALASVRVAHVYTDTVLAKLRELGAHSLAGRWSVLAAQLGPLISTSLWAWLYHKEKPF